MTHDHTIPCRGICIIGINAAHRHGEIGYWLGVPYWNQGYTTEAATRVSAYGFAELRLYRVQATCFVRNTALARVMQKAGLRYEGTLRGYVRKNGAFEDIAMYARLSSDAT